jgi:hypothetical protein
MSIPAQIAHAQRMTEHGDSSKGRSRQSAEDYFLWIAFVAWGLWRLTN